MDKEEVDYSGGGFFKGGFFKVDYWKWISLRSVFLQGWIFLIGGGVDFFKGWISLK